MPHTTFFFFPPPTYTAYLIFINSFPSSPLHHLFPHPLSIICSLIPSPSIVPYAATVLRPTHPSSRKIIITGKASFYKNDKKNEKAHALRFCIFLIFDN